MHLKTIGTERIEEFATETWGVDLTSDEALAEVLRAEVTARGSSLRASAIARSVQTLAAIAEVSKERMAEVCDMLEQLGDFSLEAGGVLHATPLRAIPIDAGAWRIVSSSPLRHLRRRFPGAFRSTGAQRQLNFSTAEEIEAVEALIAFGGAKLSPEEWAGLGYAPLADQEWLDGIEERLTWFPRAAASLERDGDLDWQALSFSDDGVRWRRGATGPARLWRARTSYGYSVFAWTGNATSPSTAPFVVLSMDDANRTMFAVARGMQKLIKVQVVHHAATSVIVIGPLLPRAEYRYLSMVSSPLPRESHMNRWSLPTVRVDEVLAVLLERLGIQREDS